MSSVFVVQHSYQRSDESASEETKFIGVYTSQSEAESAIGRLKERPGFRDLPDCFSVGEYELNVDHWQDGFVTERIVFRHSVWQRCRSGEIHLIKSGLVEDDALRLVREMTAGDQSADVWAWRDA